MNATAPHATPPGASPPVYTLITRYAVCALPPGHPHWPHYALHVEWRGGDRWAVTGLDGCRSATGKWDDEPSPSRRSARWKATHYFDRATALRIAREAAPHVGNGFPESTPADLIAGDRAAAARGLDRIARQLENGVRVTKTNRVQGTPQAFRGWLREQITGCGPGRIPSGEAKQAGREAFAALAQMLGYPVTAGDRVTPAIPLLDRPATEVARLARAAALSLQPPAHAHQPDKPEGNDPS